jgi:5-methylcytosine-specific restriction endonuclease McrBC GTP-binding regulatory subunit McrB
MQVFFGRITEKQNPTDQFNKGYYHAKKGTSYFGELNNFDSTTKESVYVFMIATNSIELWKVSHWGNNEQDLFFTKTGVDLDNMSRAWFAAFKFFYLDLDLIVFTTRRPYKKAFFKLRIDNMFTEAQILDPATYSNYDNYRNIELCKTIPPSISRNLVFHKEGEYWKFESPDFFDNSLSSQFRDNTKNIGRGRPNKDNLLKYISEANPLPKELNPDDLSLLNVYDIFFCDYNGIIEDEILLNPDDNCYKISMSPKDIDEDSFVEMIEQNVITIHKNTPAKGASYETQSETFSEKIKIGDYFYLCRGNNKLILLGRITSISEPSFLEEYNDEGWIQRQFEIVKLATTDEKYEGANKWWTPNHVSTCIQIPDNELTLANTLIFAPYFSTSLKKMSPPSFSTDEDGAKNHMPNMSLNTILYGPPGTGKTYCTIDMALEILNQNLIHSREGRKKLFANFQKEQRIFFTTFHQNMAYEDFIEGIKPIAPEEEDDFLKYEIQDGLFMKACIEATYSILSKKLIQNNDEIKNYLDYNALFDLLYDEVVEKGNIQLSTKSQVEVIASTTSQGNFSIRHIGKEKPYTVSRERLAVLYEKFPDLNLISNITNEFRNAIGGCNSTAYWSVLNKLQEIEKSKKETTKSDTSVNEILETNLSYEHKKTIVKKYWTLRDTNPIVDENIEPFIFIIDEINRGNVSQIFGELITLIEDDKRVGKPEVLYIELPYSKQPFAVPPNLFILGTMNTADRSVEALDTALRRRFSFIPKLPEESKLGTTIDGIALPKLLYTINSRLKILKDSDHTIGHAWLWNVTNLESLKIVFRDKILPLLQEYFYNDYEKLGLVLGDAFFKPHVQINSNIFASFTGGNGLAGQYNQTWQYQLKSVDELTIDDFKSLEQLNNGPKTDEE